MDLTNSQPGESDAVKKLEQDLQNVSQHAAATQQQPAPVTAPVPQNPPQPTMPPAAPSAPVTPIETNVPVPENPKKGSPLMVIAIILALIAVLAVVAYVFGAKLLTPQLTPTPVAVVTPTAIPDITLDWKTYSNSALSFKYPSDWTTNGPFVLTGLNPTIKVAAAEGSTLMNECMQQISVESRDSLTLRKFSSVTTAEACSGEDTSALETWVVGSPTSFGPGIIISYSATDSAVVDPIVNGIVSTFSFVSATPSASATATPLASPSATP